MRTESMLQKLEIYVVASVAVILVSGIAFVLSAQDHQASEVSVTAPAASSSASSETQPALLEPALRSLDGAVDHG